MPGAESLLCFTWLVGVQGLGEDLADTVELTALKPPVLTIVHGMAGPRSNPAEMSSSTRGGGGKV